MRKNDTFRTCLVNGKEVKLFDLAIYKGNILKEINGQLEIIYEDVNLIYNITTDTFSLDEVSSYAFILQNDFAKLNEEERDFYFKKIEEYSFPYSNDSSNKGYVDVGSLKLVSRAQFEGQFIDSEIQKELENCPSKKR